MRLRRFARRVIVVLVVLSGVSCAPIDGGTPHNGPPEVSSFQQLCQAFCQHLRVLGCPEGAPLADGTSCETFCIDTQEAGHSLNIPCILQVQGCAELQRCR
jgi:hypothetical protein